MNIHGIWCVKILKFLLNQLEGLCKQVLSGSQTWASGATGQRC